jgi:WD40 repeat protein
MRSSQSSSSWVCRITSVVGILISAGVARAETPEFEWLRGGHGHVVARVEYSPDGQLFVTASGDNSAKLWRASDGQLLRSLIGHTASVQSADFSPDGSRVVTSGWDNKVRIWNTAAGTLQLTISDPSTFFNVARFSPDGSTVCAAGGSLGTLKLYSATTGALVRSFTGHSDWVNDLAFSPDGTRIASASSDDTVRTWNVASGAQQWSIVAHDTQAVSVDWSADGTILASAGGVIQPRVKTWNAANGALIRAYVGQTQQANDVKFSPDGQRIAGSGGDGQIRIWSVATAVLQLSIPVSAPPTIVSNIDFTTDGSRILAGDNERRVTLWNAGNAQLEREITAHPGWVHGLDYSPDGATLATAGFVIPLLCPVKLYSVASGEPTGELGDVPWGLTDLDYSSDGRYIAGSSGSGVTYLVDLSNQSPDYTVPVSAPPDFPWFSRFAPDDSIVATGGTEGTVQLWSVADPPQFIDFLDFGAASARDAEFTPDGAKLVVAVGASIVIWDLVADQITTLAGTVAQNIADIEIASNGATFFAAYGAGTAGTYTIREIAFGTHQVVRTFAGHTDQVHSIDVSSDGRFLVSGAADFTVRLWSVVDGTLLRTYDQECGFATAIGAEGVPRVKFAPNNKTFAYGRNDGTIAVARNPYAFVWTDLGSGLAGGGGVPNLKGAGTLEPASSVEVTLKNALPNSASALVIGLTSVGLPLYGGLLVPSPDVVIAPLPTGSSGGWSLASTWPAGVPSGTSIYLQAWISDPGAVLGCAATNGLEGVAP